MECRLDDITIHYESLGTGRPLVFLPGWPDSGRVPAAYLEPLFSGRTDWRRIYLDLPGRGATKGEPWITTNDQVLDIVLAVIDQVIPGERFVLGGHSAGAYLARAVLRRRFRLVDGLLQVVPVIDPDGDARPEPVTLVSEPGIFERITAELGSDAAAQYARVAVVASAEVYERVKPVMAGVRDDPFLDRLDDRVSFKVDDLPSGGRTRSSASAARSACWTPTRGRQSPCSIGQAMGSRGNKKSCSGPSSANGCHGSKSSSMDDIDPGDITNTRRCRGEFPCLPGPASPPPFRVAPATHRQHAEG
jgi:pimeloyl-ACP methyl ester carboxylesterase